MARPDSPLTALAAGALPPELRALAERFAATGHPLSLFGPGLRELLQGLAAREFHLSTTAPRELVLELLPHAVETRPAESTLLLPFGAWRADLTLRAARPLADQLAACGFTIHALAWDPLRDAWTDPWGGRDDLAARTLRTVGPAAQLLREAPLLALQAARWCAWLDFELAGDLVDALRANRSAPAELPAGRTREEIAALLLAPRPARGLALLRESGLAQRWLGFAPQDLGDWIAALPPRIDLRLAAWLRGGSAGRNLQRLGFGSATIRRVRALLALHPIEQRIGDPRTLALQRPLRALGADLFGAALALRRAELGAAQDRASVDERLDRLEEAWRTSERADALRRERQQLPIDGATVMRLLGIGPGPRVGQALAHLLDYARRAPQPPTSEELTDALARWRLREGES